MKIKIISKKNYPELKKLYNKLDISEDADVCLAVGGDGTFIRHSTLLSSIMGPPAVLLYAVEPIALVTKKPSPLIRYFN